MNTEHELMMSKTLERLYQIAQNMPCDVTKADELKTALATSGADLINALDNDRIHFDSQADRAMFFGLLTVTMDYVLDGRLKHAFRKATVN